LAENLENLPAVKWAARRYFVFADGSHDGDDGDDGSHGGDDCDTPTN
jgi:hypothetical protein